jgi:hypothetical protein
MNNIFKLFHEGIKPVPRGNIIPKTKKTSSNRKLLNLSIDHLMVSLLLCGVQFHGVKCPTSHVIRMDYKEIVKL